MRNSISVVAFLSMLPLLLSVSCITESSTWTKTFIKNTSGEKIEFIFYMDRVVVDQLSQEIEYQETKLVDESRSLGKGKGTPPPVNAAQIDSLIVLFNGARKATHYPIDNYGSNSKAIKYSSPRNLFNDSNYSRKVVEETKHSIQDEFTYTFTAQDYLDAKLKNHA